ncbi:MAG: hypothetical protein JWP92_741 [Caulobacter sp.]|nr:hypothetical protein [Caulobacter sp.]
MRPMLRRLALVAGAALTVAAAAASAQTPPVPPAPPEPSMRGMPPMPPMPPMGGEFRKLTREHRDPAAHAQRLRDLLQLRSDQEPALQAYLAANAPKARREKDEPEKARDDAPKAPLTTPERLDREAEHLAKMAAMVRARADATKAFYAALSPSQRKAFDALGPELGGPGMMIHRLEIRHDGPGLGAHGLMMKRKAG